MSISFKMLVNSYAMFGSYYNTLPLLLRVHHLLFPSFQFWLYHDGSANNYYYSETMAVLQSAGLVRIIQVDLPVMKCQSMLWRMLPIWDSSVNYCFCRDLDSVPVPRERQSVDEFIKSGLTVHGINDNDQHTTPMMGGMVGFKTKEFLDLTKFVDFNSMVNVGWSEEKWKTHGADQQFMFNYLWPRVKDKAMLHVFAGGGDYTRNVTTKTTTNIELADVSNTVQENANAFSSYIGASGQDMPAEDIIEYCNSNANAAIETINNVEENITMVKQNTEYKQWLVGNKRKVWLNNGIINE